MLINVVAQDPDLRVIEKIIKIINNDGLIVIPTDTIYAFAISMKSKKGLERLAKIKKIKLKNANFSLICQDLKEISTFTKPFDRKTFKTLKNALPGPFTFILKASSQIPKLFDTNRKSIGIRIHQIHARFFIRLGPNSTAIQIGTSPRGKLFQMFRAHQEHERPRSAGDCDYSRALDCGGVRADKFCGW